MTRRLYPAGVAVLAALLLSSVLGAARVDAATTAGTPPSNTPSLVAPDETTPKKLVREGTSLSLEAHRTMEERLALAGQADDTPQPPRSILTGGPSYTATCYPDSVPYATGSCDYWQWTSPSIVYGNRPYGSDDRGWFMFNTTSIPDDATITSVELHAYLYAQHYASWAITRVTQTKPKRDGENAVFPDLGYWDNYGEHPTYYYLSYDDAPPGWNTINLGSLACSDLSGRLTDNWWAVGLDELDSYYEYWISFYGWTNPVYRPHIVVTYTLPPPDAATVSIDYPVGTLPVGGPYYPKATVQNLGSTAQSFDVLFSIDDGYASTKPTDVLAANQTQQLTFDAWHPTGPGTFQTKCTTELDSDIDNSNDCQIGSATVPVLDATVDFVPHRMPLKSHLPLLTCYIELPVGYSVSDINPSTVAISAIEGVPLASPIYITNPPAPTVGNYDGDAFDDLMVKFDLQVLLGILAEKGYGAGDEVALTVTGSLKNEGGFFAGSDVILLMESHGGGQDQDQTLAGIPKYLSVQQSSPNPFQLTTALKYGLPSEAHVRVAIYSQTGQQVASLVDRIENAGYHSASWNGRDDSGRQLAAGVYFFRFDVGNYSTTRRSQLLR